MEEEAVNQTIVPIKIRPMSRRKSVRRRQEYSTGIRDPPGRVKLLG